MKKVFLIIVIVLLVFVSYTIGKKSSETQNQEIISETSDETVDVQYQYIPELGLRYEITEENKDFEYAYKPPKNSSHDTTHLGSLMFQYKPEVKNVWDSCYLPSISRKSVDPVKENFAQASPETVRKIGEMFYIIYIYDMQEPCFLNNVISENSAISGQDFEDWMDRRNIVLKIFQSLEPIN